jgi:hypothetical protein
MKITLTDENGKSIQINITDEEYSKLFPTVKKTGYERVNGGEKFYLPANAGSIITYHDDHSSIDDTLYNVANYYSSKTVAENNARADKLMRQLRRFAIEHRKKPIDWTSPIANLHEKWEIMYSCPRDAEHKLYVTSLMNMTKGFGRVYFDEYSTALLAIDTFKDELLWYFTEYKDSL